MSRQIPFPTFATPPEEYNARYMSDVVRSLSALTAILGNPGEGRHTKLVLTDLPTEASGLEVGTVYRTNNLLYVAVANIAAVSGASMTLSLGDVTVSIA